MKKRNKTTKSSTQKTSSEAHINFGPKAESLARVIIEALEIREYEEKQCKRDLVKIDSDLDQIKSTLRDHFEIEELAELIRQEHSKPKKLLMILGLTGLLEGMQ